MGELSPIHWMIVIGVVVLLFGSRKLPDAARAVGQSLRILRAEAGQLQQEERGNYRTEHGNAVAQKTDEAVGDEAVFDEAVGDDSARDGHRGEPGPGGA